MVSSAPDDRVLPLTRWVAAAIVLVLIAAVWLLYLLPDNTAQLWSWTIRPRMSALLMGAGYAAGAYFFLRVAVLAGWHEVSRGFFAITAFTWLVGLATNVHWDRFNHQHISFFAWAGLYFTTPFIVPALWLYNRHTDSGTFARDDVALPSRVRQVMLVTGIGILALSFLLIALPAQAMQVWPWKLSLLSSRTVGSFFALPGVALVALSGDPRWSASRIMLESLALAFVLLLIAVARAWGDFDKANVLSWVYLGALVVGLVALAVLYASMEVRRRRSRSRTGVLR
jgi:hypothetical protein